MKRLVVNDVYVTRTRGAGSPDKSLQFYEPAKTNARGVVQYPSLVFFGSLDGWNCKLLRCASHPAHRHVANASARFRIHAIRAHQVATAQLPCEQRRSRKGLYSTYDKSDVISTHNRITIHESIQDEPREYNSSRWQLLFVAGERMGQAR